MLPILEVQKMGCKLIAELNLGLLTQLFILCSTLLGKPREYRRVSQMLSVFRKLSPELLGRAFTPPLDNDLGKRGVSYHAPEHADSIDTGPSIQTTSPSFLSTDQVSKTFPVWMYRRPSSKRERLETL